MKKNIILIVLLFCSTFSFAQKIGELINAQEAERIERILSADDMQGRKTFTAGNDKAAEFIATEFGKSGLQPLGNNSSYFQEISMIKTKPVSISGSLDELALTTENVAALSTNATIDIHSLKDYQLGYVKKEDEFGKTLFPMIESEKNMVILIDTSHARKFKSIQRFTGNAKFPSSFTQIFILTTIQNPASLQLHIENQLSEQKLKNVVGIIPGTGNKKNEYVIFSGHYDHLGIGKPNADKDSIYNGANDDASGITALILLSRYFSKQKNNNRTIVFAAFTAEEIGGFGSQYFSKQLDAEKVAAMFNIEMIGTESKWGTNSAYITGYEKSDFGKILQSNLSGSKFHFEPDPYPKENLFYRSDNATLAELGVPAHTISTSKMDTEKYYHTLDDEMETLDMNNMAEIIKAIALSSQSIISGKDTPSRIAKEKGE
ncbi:MAG: M20/M25/M40 family metallo-hydrolase [Bacteroidetes bacterium]|nr:M20/M25/M40 family metallo-hydrolase [Bacteroidota bacterium]